MTWADRYRGARICGVGQRRWAIREASAAGLEVRRTVTLRGRGRGGMMVEVLVVEVER